MRASKWIALCLAVTVVSGVLPGCSVMRTPYERQKIAEQGGKAKKEQEPTEAGGGEGQEGGEKKGAGKASAAGKKQDEKTQRMIKREKQESEKMPNPRMSENLGEKKERQKGQGLLYVVPRFVERTDETGHYDEPQRERRQVADVPVKRPGVVAMPEVQAVPERGKEKEYRLLYSKAMTSEVSRLEGVEGGTVLLDHKNQAYVAISDRAAVKTYVRAPLKADETLKVKVEGKVPTPLQEKIVKTLRGMDPTVGTVYITSNPEHVESFERYAGQTQEGRVNSLESKALADHIQDIWKK